MNSRDFLAVAEELIEGDTEAHWRSAVSRAYYAAFHVARLLMGRCGFRVPESDRAHAYLGHRLNNAGHDGASQAGRRLDLLRDLRNEADYDLWRGLSRGDADARVEMARSVIEALEAAEADDAVLSAITEAMRDYERGRGDVTWKG